MVEHEPPSRAYVMLSQFVAGGGAGTITKTCIAPLERIKILFQLQHMKLESLSSTERAAFVPKYGTSVLSCSKVIFKEDGIRGFWRGNFANVMRVAPAYAVKFSANDAIRDLVRRPEQTCAADMDMLQLMASGAMAGVLQTIATYPLETVRTRLSLGANAYSGVWQCFVRTAKEEGLSALYKGMPMTLVSVIPFVGLQMSCNELFRRFLPRDEQGRTGVVAGLTAGGLAGLIAQTITFPGDTIRRRMQTNGMHGKARVYKHTGDCIMRMIKTEGFRSFFRGVGVNAARCVPGSAIQFVAYDLLRQAMNDK
ncbi:MAG: hypothetical protein MHM6MM_000893 [Cercozoa sp. M6MM]